MTIDESDPVISAGMREGRRRALGYVSYVVGVALVLGASSALLRLFEHRDFVLIIAALVGLTLAAVFVLAAAEAFLAPSARAVMAKDPRPPVVYLRPFGEDREHTYDYVSSGETSAPLKAKAEDFLLPLNAIGPLVSIAEPKLSARCGMHPLGTARDFIGAGDWQARVRELLDDAGMVVLAIGDSAGIEWEIAEVRARVPPQSVLLYLPPRPTKAWTSKGRKQNEREIYEAYATLVERYFGVQLPPFDSALHVIGFDSTGQPITPKLAAPHSWLTNERTRVGMLIRQQLDEVLAMVRPGVQLADYRVPGRFARGLRTTLAMLPFAATLLLVLVAAAAGLGMSAHPAELIEGLVIPAVPGIALVTGWVLLARHFRRRWVWIVPLLLAAGVAAGLLQQASILFGWLHDGSMMVQKVFAGVRFLLHSGSAFAIFALGVMVANAPFAADTRPRP